MTRLQERYQKEAAPKVAQEFQIKNPMAIPKISKVVINMGVGKDARIKEVFEVLKKDLAKITGQIPSVRPAKVSIASFNVRRGMPVGLSVTLRGERMYSFLDKLISIVLPRLRDFRGVSGKSFDKYGNYTLGLPDQTVFPEIEVGKSAGHGLEIVIVIEPSNPEKSKKLLELLGMPFVKNI